jgi:hypothetical protein
MPEYVTWLVMGVAFVIGLLLGNALIRMLCRFRLSERYWADKLAYDILALPAEERRKMLDLVRARHPKLYVLVSRRLRDLHDVGKDKGVHP